MKAKSIYEMSEAELTDHVALLAQQLAEHESRPENKATGGFLLLTKKAKAKSDKMSLSIKQAMDQRSHLQGKTVVGYGFSNYKR